MKYIIQSLLFKFLKMPPHLPTGQLLLSMSNGEIIMIFFPINFKGQKNIFTFL